MKKFQFWPLARDVLKLTARQAAFPDSTYNFDHAGDPQIMPQLTFEDFKEFHWNNYHRSNARIWFYGNDDPTKRLHILSGDLEKKNMVCLSWLLCGD